jgi:hypothetical protein
MKTYTVDDLLNLVNLGRFGSPEMNQLAGSAFVQLKKVLAENERLTNIIENKNYGSINIFGTSLDTSNITHINK